MPTAPAALVNCPQARAKDPVIELVARFRQERFDETQALAALEDHLRRALNPIEREVREHKLNHARTVALARARSEYDRMALLCAALPAQRPDPAVDAALDSAAA